MIAPIIAAVNVDSQFSQIRSAQINVRGSVDGVAIYIDGKHGRSAIYLETDQAAGLCFKLHGAVRESQRANGVGRG